MTKSGGWVIAAGVRDWGLVPRYPPTPLWDKVYDARIRYAEAMRGRGLGDIVGGGGHPQAARRVPEWFIAAGLKDLKVEAKIYRLQYHGSEEAQPHYIDMLPYGGQDEYGWYARFDETYRAMIAERFIDEDLLQRATDEARAWYKDPRAFHFWVKVFAAGKV